MVQTRRGICDIRIHTMPFPVRDVARVRGAISAERLFGPRIRALQIVVIAFVDDRQSARSKLSRARACTSVRTCMDSCELLESDVFWIRHPFRRLMPLTAPGHPSSPNINGLGLAPPPPPAMTGRGRGN